jgi:hypothetical protein
MVQNETWHWELQYEGKYAKINKSQYFIDSNIKNNGRNGSGQYSVNFKQAMINFIKNLVNPIYFITLNQKVINVLVSRK